MTPPELIAGKLCDWVAATSQAQGGTDWRDLAMLLLTFPKLKTEDGTVADRLCAMKSGAVMSGLEEAGATETIGGRG